MSLGKENVAFTLDWWRVVSFNKTWHKGIEAGFKGRFSLVGDWIWMEYWRWDADLLYYYKI